MLLSGILIIIYLDSPPPHRELQELLEVCGFRYCESIFHVTEYLLELLRLMFSDPCSEEFIWIVFSMDIQSIIKTANAFAKRGFRLGTNRV